MTKPSFKINLVLAIVGVLTVSAGRAMCAATTENLVRVEVYACQQIKIGASSSRPPAHAIHKRGSSITGILITGRVIESEIVWDADSNDAAYLVEAGKVSPGESSTFFLNGNASKICSVLVGTEKTFITERPCCDVIPADGVCLVPWSMTIVKEEKRPERWTKWKPDS